MNAVAVLVNSGERGVLTGGLKGVEKESLRVTPSGRIAETPHPAALGSALTNDNITTDYSEALIETAPGSSGDVFEPSCTRPAGLYFKSTCRAS